MKSVISKMPVIINIIICLLWEYVADFWWYEIGEWLDSIHWKYFVYREGCMIADLRTSVISMVIMPLLYVITVLVIVLMSKLFSGDTRRRNYLQGSILIVTVVDVLFTIHLYKERLPGLIEYINRYGLSL